MKFTKMHGAGNDYIYVYLPENPIQNPAEFSQKWSRPHFGIGSDGLITIDKSQVADFMMRIYNNDGSEAMMCGNGIRCVAKFVYDHKLTDKRRISIDTLSGIKVIDLQIDAEGRCTGATVMMGQARIVANDDVSHQFAVKQSEGTLPHTHKVGGYEGTFVSMGNPHFVIFVPDVMSMDIAAEGKPMEFNPAFPERCNIEFATVMPDGTIRMRVWERGSGITMACGTGACATAVAAFLTGRCAAESNIEMDGGRLHISYDKESGLVHMTGPAETAFEGIIEE